MLKLGIYERVGGGRFVNISIKDVIVVSQLIWIWFGVCGTSILVSSIGGIIIIIVINNVGIPIGCISDVILGFGCCGHF